MGNAAADLRTKGAQMTKQAKILTDAQIKAALATVTDANGKRYVRQTLVEPARIIEQMKEQP